VRVKELLNSLNLGNSVAEFDTDLKNHFVETQAFRKVIMGEADIIAGDKGTGKTALYTVLKERYRDYPELRNVEVLPAFNPVGNPVFQRLVQVPILEEGQYVTVWKSYFLSLIGNWLLELVGDEKSIQLEKLDSLLKKTGLRSPDDSANTVFTKVVNVLSRIAHPKSAQVGITLSEQGIPVITPKVEFGSDEKAQHPVEVIAHEKALQALDECLEEVGVTVWIMLDRLDEAFQGFPAVERAALRALFRTYLDLLEFSHVRIKLFVRRDLFRKVVHGGFVNLTHVNARRFDIVWDEDDLLSLLCRRVRANKEFVLAVGGSSLTDRALFATIFPPQIDVGEKKPPTWAWIMSRIRDGNNIKPPRNLIDLTKKAQEAQSRAEEREAREFAPGPPVIQADAVRRALRRLSEDRVNDTLLAEAADLAPTIELFRDGKAEHNVNSLAQVLGVPENEVRSKIKPLVELGFLEEISDTFKVPMLYRGGLEITQGKAFAPDEAPEEDA
jgi:hypothetical protein